MTIALFKEQKVLRYCIHKSALVLILGNDAQIIYGYGYPDAIKHFSNRERPLFSIFFQCFQLHPPPLLQNKGDLIYEIFLTSPLRLFKERQKI